LFPSSRPNVAGVKRYLCSYVSDGIEHSVKIWASSEAEALEKLRALPWELGNGPVASPRTQQRDDHEVARSVALLVLVMLTVGMSAMIFRSAEADIRQVEASGHFKHLSHLLSPQKHHHQA
jgi:hypothetical protein